jgi:hypothetical protein
VPESTVTVSALTDAKETNASKSLVKKSVPVNTISPEEISTAVTFGKLPVSS